MYLSTARTNSILSRKFRSQRGGMGGVAEDGPLLAALGLIVTLAAGGAYAFFGTSKSAAEFSTIDTLSTNIRSLYGGTYPAQDLSSDLIGNHQTGNIRTDGNATIYNQTGGVITPTGNGGSYSITDANISYDACVYILSHIPPAGYTSAAGTDGTVLTTFKIPTDTAQQHCTKGSNANSVTVTAQ